MFTTWKTLERHSAFYLPPVSSIEITAKRYSTVPFIVSKKKKERKYIYSPSPFVNDEFAYEMKECPPRIKDRIYTFPFVFLIFSPLRPMHMHLPRSSRATNRPSSSLCTSEFLIPKMHRQRYEPRLHISLFPPNFYTFPQISHLQARK